jgi:hypothetical protein
MKPENAASQTIQLEVKPISKLVVDGNPKPLILDYESINSGQFSLTDMSTTYSLISNLDNLKIIVSISDNMPNGTRLKLKLASKNAQSHGYVDISKALAPVEVVMGIQKGNEINQSIAYEFSIDPDVIIIPTQSRNITLTLTN